MKIASACIYALNIPFVQTFSHNLCERDHADSIIVKLTTGCGVSGFGEGSYGPHLLAEDIAQEDIAFGHGGHAPVLTGPGLGIRVCEEALDRFGA